MESITRTFVRRPKLALVLALVLAIIVYYAVRDSLASSRFHPDAPIFKSSK